MVSQNTRFAAYLIIVLLSAYGCAQSDVSNTPAPECSETNKCSGPRLCVEGKCVPNPCLDKVLSKGETDIDCGGPQCDACELEQHCLVASDCLSKECENEVCVDPNRPCRTPRRGELVFSEIMNNLENGATFDRSTKQQNEFFEIYNTTRSSIGLQYVTLECQSIDDDTLPPVSVSLDGCMASHQAAVLSVSSIDVPEDVLNVTVIPSSSFLPHEGSYECRLLNADKQTLTRAYLVGGYDPGISETTDSLVYNADGVQLSAHDTLSRFRHTPGLCYNGALFSNNCDTLCDNGKKDGDETDIDCGGALCAPCSLSRSCKINDDCESGLCQELKCAEPPKTCRELGCANGFCDEMSGECFSCHDNKHNGDELDTDCGGAYCIACSPGQYCNEDDDCLSESCVNHTCASGKNLSVFTPIKGEILISEFFNVAAQNRTMSVWQSGVTQYQAEFIELVNPTTNIMDLEGLTLTIRNMSTNEVYAEWPLYGSLVGQRSLVISKSKLAGLPPHTRNLTLIPKDACFDDQANVLITLSNKTNPNNVITYHEVGADQPTSGVSDVLNPLMYTALTRTLTKHNVANPALPHSPGYCTNGALFANGCDTLCDNDAFDGDETDMDCGGPVCAPCEVGKRCVRDRDCESLHCGGGFCQDKPCTEVGCGSDSWCNTSTGKCYSCQDNEQNGDETDVDCGGTRCGGCAKNQKCSKNDDCQSQLCSYGRCTGDPCIAPTAASLLITEVMGSPNSNTNYFFDTAPKTNQMEFIEFVNPGPSRIDLRHVTLNWLVDGGSSAPNSVSFTGCLEPKSSIVVSHAAIADFPSEVTNLTSMKSATMIGNKDKYRVWLTNGDTTIDSVNRKGNESQSTYKGASQTREPQLASSAPDLVFTNDVSAFKNTPGYCSNGGRFSELCKDPCNDGRITWNETDVDCGGNICAKCAQNKMCKEDSDCASMNCSSGRCVGDPCYTPVAGELLITEVMGSPDAKKQFDFLTGVNQQEFIEIANNSSRRLNLSEVQVKWLQSGATTSNTASLTGCIEPNGAIVLSNTAISGLPSGVSNQTAMTSNSMITNGSEYTFWIETTATPAVRIDTATRAGNGATKTKGVSQVRNPTLEKTAITLQLSNTISSYNNSPGYCSNGNTFASSCRTP